jgi:hypothetical protein
MEKRNKSQMSGSITTSYPEESKMKKYPLIRESQEFPHKENDHGFLKFCVKVLSLFVASTIFLAFAILLLYTTLTAGCVTLAKTTYADMTATPAPPTPVPTPTAEITPDPIPTPEPTLPYDLWKYSRKQFNMSEWYTIQRNDVSGQKDLILNTTVYRIREYMNFYTWEWYWGGPTDGSADWVNLPQKGNKFVFIWVCEYMDGSNQTYDPSFWGRDYEHFRLQVNNTVYQNIMHKVDMTAPIREFEYLYDYGDTVRTGPFGMRVVQDLGTGKYTAEPMSFMRMGFSNREDGWIIFEVPKETKLSEIMIIGDFGHLAKPAYWSVTPMMGY